MSKPYTYAVLSSRPTTPTTQILTLYSLDRQHALVFEPGQSAAVSFTLPKHRHTKSRQFPIANAPTEQGFLQLTLPIDGSFTRAELDKFTPGTQAAVSGPYGSFVYNPDRDQSTMLLADGVGIAPLLSMIRYATRLKLESEIALAYSCRTQDDILYLQELIKLRELNPRFGIMFVVEDGPVDKLDDEYVTKGQIDGQLLDYLVSGSYTPRSYFVCGPAAFTKSMSALLQLKSVPTESIMSETLSQGEVQGRA